MKEIQQDFRKNQSIYFHKSYRLYEKKLRSFKENKIIKCSIKKIILKSISTRHGVIYILILDRYYFLNTLVNFFL